jgi:hypothetical protein
VEKFKQKKKKKKKKQKQKRTVGAEGLGGGAEIGVLVVVAIGGEGAELGTSIRRVVDVSKGSASSIHRHAQFEGIPPLPPDVHSVSLVRDAHSCAHAPAAASNSSAAIITSQ